MRLRIPGGLRYWLVGLLESKPSAFTSCVLRLLILATLVLMVAPWRAAQEIAIAKPGGRSDLKSAFRAMLWAWNRSWLPLKFKFDTFFDIGWYLSGESCQALSRRGFLSRDPPKRQCDLAQLELASIREALDSGDQSRLARADEEICSLVIGVFSHAKSWADLAGAGAESPSPQPSAVDIPADKAGKRFDNDRTRSALLDFDDLSRTLGLRYFLVSGTFLGVVRDGAFIGHDHDIDLGVFEEDLSEQLLPALSASQNFTVTQVDYICLRQSHANEVHYAFMERPAIIRLAHKSGISVDLFIHFRDGGLVWHGSSVHRWNNVAFELRDYEFLGRTFKGAVDFDRYLTENYGSDWRVPKSAFNVNFDTPNLSFVGSANALVYFAWLATYFVAEKNVVAVRRCIDMLLALGVVESADGNLNIK